MPFVWVTKEEFPEYVKENVKEGIFMTVGAGDIDRFIPIFTEDTPLIFTEDAGSAVPP